MTSLEQPQQFSKPELEIINDALLFLINCLDEDQIHLYADAKLVLTKVESILKDSK